MTLFAPLNASDPERLGDYALLGRLGEGGQGVVYLATAPDDRQVAVKWLRPELAGDEVSVTRFLREVHVAEQVAPFCTAAVLAKGVAQERPFIVSEYIEGPSLQRIVLDDGPRSGNGLLRLAIGTATALAAIHQAGIVHRDFKPANVLLAADGPRVIDFGIARALDANVTISNMPVGTPSYMAPEQIMGEKVGAAADLFSWANTIVYAATGRAPFGNDTMHAVINRVLNQPPDVSALEEGPLKEVVLACLAKDPGARPTAEQVIHRLLHHPTALPDAAAAAAGPPSLAGPHAPGYPGHPGGPGHSGALAPPTPLPGGHPGAPRGWVGEAGQDGGPASQGGHPAGQGRSPVGQGGGPGRAGRGGWSGRRGLVIGAAAAFVAVLVTGLLLIAPWSAGTQEPQVAKPPPGGPTEQPGKPSDGSSRQPTKQPTQPPTEQPKPKTKATPVPLPGGKATLYETRDDPVRLTSYEIRNSDGEWVDYARASLTGKFATYPAHWESLVSPDGRYLAGRARDYTPDGYDPVIITDRETGARHTVKTVKRPLNASLRAWSKDGTRLLLNVERNVGGEWVNLGFTVIDVRSKKASTVTTKGRSAFGWNGASDGVVSWDAEAGALQFLDLSGRLRRTVKEVGTLPAGTDRLFSPSGRRFVTTCADGRHCVWDTATGENTTRFTSDCDKVLGWFDENSLYCWELDNGRRHEVRVVGFDGRADRLLLESEKGLELSPVFTLNHPTS
ncbi:protein kinase [Nonomuraea sp. NPDC050328]|uniref:protein kinase domain-containing protein n=1 Tax=Nonomuraea sp. NPDC050328 TaxID=3364361 RepID=UPI0037B490EB